MLVPVKVCACGCGAPVKRSGARGPAPVYAGPACRKRAQRSRLAASEFVPAGVLEVIPGGLTSDRASASADDQVARAILEARAVAFAFIRLGVEARPELAWRCASFGERVLAELAQYFGEAQ